MFTRLGNFVLKFRWAVIAVWVVAAVAMFLFAPSLSKTGTMNQTSFLPKNSASQKAADLINRYFPGGEASSDATLVFFDSAGLSDADYAYAQSVQAWLLSDAPTFKVEGVTSIFTSPELAPRLVSPDKTTMLLNVGLGHSSLDSQSGKNVTEMRDYLKNAPQGLSVYVSGQAGIYADLLSSLTQSIDLTTIITVALVVVLLLLIYRSPVAFLVPLFTIGIAFAVARGVLGLIAQAGVSVWSQIDVFVIVLVFGAGTDYCLFMVSRFREELGRNESRAGAVKATVGRIGAVITASAFAVIIGLSGMAVARYQMIQTMGPVMGVAVFVTLLAALTLTPALASILGAKLFWPAHAEVKRNDNGGKPGFWARVARITTGYPYIVAPVVIAVMAVPFIALPGMNRSYDELAELPPKSDSVQGYRVLEQHYDVGEMDPLTAIVVAPKSGSITGPEALAALVQTGNALRSVNGVAKVQSLVQPYGTADVPAELTVSGQLTSMAGGLTGGSGGSTSDPSALLSGELAQGLTRIGTYLNDLAASFPWVKQEPAYEGMGKALSDIQTSLQTIQSGALVTNQLNAMAMQLDQIAAAMSSGDPSVLQGGSTQSISLIGAYLQELAGQYPWVTSNSDYQGALTLLASMQSSLGQLGSLPPEQLPAAMQQASASLKQLVIDLSGLKDAFAARGTAYFFSATLAQAAGGDSATAALQAQFAALGQQAGALAARFEAQGGPCFIPASLSSDPQMAQMLSLFVSQDASAARMYVVLGSSPQSNEAMATVKQLRAALASSLKDPSLAGYQAAIGGSSATLTDVSTMLNTDFNRVMIVVVAGILLVFVALLRSVVAPVYLLLTVLLSYATTLGIVTFIFQGILGQEGVSFIVPIMIFVLLVALGADYNIFLMSRVREESETKPTRQATQIAAGATGAVITACGMILAGTFGILVISPLRIMVQVGAAVGIGILIDTFVVRTLLVPAIATLIGRWNWWPSKLSRKAEAVEPGIAPVARPMQAK